MKRRYISLSFIITNLIRLILILALITALRESRAIILAFSVVALAATFLPAIMEKLFGTRPRAEMQIIILLIIYGMLFIGEVRGLHQSAWWWGILINLFAAIALGFIGLTIISFLTEAEIIDTSPFMTVLLSFSLAFAMSGLIEIIQYFIDNMFGFTLQLIGTGNTARDLMINAIGAIVVSFGGYIYMKYTKSNLASNFITRFLEKNPKLFKSRKYLENQSEKILALISKGEGPKLEFKSFIRTNLHTGQYDKEIELANLKTLVAYLNTEGGTLLIGVSDKGEVTGLEKDNFESNDKLKLHLSNLIRQHIGHQYFPFINYELYPIQDKHVLKIDCLPCNKRVFLKVGKEEEFYIRNGPSSAKLSGNALIDYIANRFG